MLSTAFVPLFHLYKIKTHAIHTNCTKSASVYQNWSTLVFLFFFCHFFRHTTIHCILQINVSILNVKQKSCKRRSLEIRSSSKKKKRWAMEKTLEWICIIIHHQLEGLVYWSLLLWNMLSSPWKYQTKQVSISPFMAWLMSSIVELLTLQHLFLRYRLGEYTIVVARAFWYHFLLKHIHVKSSSKSQCFGNNSNDNWNTALMAAYPVMIFWEGRGIDENKSFDPEFGNWKRELKN